jgi:hypothetical protein
MNAAVYFGVRKVTMPESFNDPPHHRISYVMDFLTQGRRSAEITLYSPSAGYVVSAILTPASTD